MSFLYEHVFQPYFIEVPVPSQVSDVLCVRGVDFAPFYDFSIRFRDCSDSVVFFVFLLDLGTVPTVWYFLFFYQIQGLFRQCGIFCFSIRFRDCSDSVVFFVFLLDLGTVPTVWYFLFFYQIQGLLGSVSIRFRDCSDSVVFFVFLSDLGTVPTVWYFFVFLLDLGSVPTV